MQLKVPARPMTVGELLTKLREHARNMKVEFDYSYMMPGKLKAFFVKGMRLAFVYEHRNIDDTDYNVGQIIDRLEKVVGTALKAPNGRKLTVSADTEIWVTHEGEDPKTGIIDVSIKGHNLCLGTWMYPSLLRSFDPDRALKISEVVTRLARFDASARVVLDHGDTLPTELISWRGSYDLLSIGCTRNSDEYRGILTVGDLLRELKAAIGKTFPGYKGGEYMMSSGTHLLVSHYKEAEHTGVVGIDKPENDVIIRTWKNR